MQVNIIHVSSKGQIVIPASWRKRMDIQEGDELLAIGDDDSILIKKVERTSLKREFEQAAKDVRKRAKKLGLTPQDLQDAIKEARESA